MASIRAPTSARYYSCKALPAACQDVSPPDCACWESSMDEGDRSVVEGNGVDGILVEVPRI